LERDHNLGSREFPNRRSVEANLGEGVVAVPALKYACFNTRICRPVGLSPEERLQVVCFAIDRLGSKYDTRTSTLWVIFFPQSYRVSNGCQMINRLGILTNPKYLSALRRRQNGNDANRRLPVLL
jgi:hypothetical protein